jgi:hypothetical protein
MTTRTRTQSETKLEAESFKGITRFQAGAYIAQRRKARIDPGTGRPTRQEDMAREIGMKQSNYMTFYEKGRYDVRNSQHFVDILAFLRITPGQALEHLGVKAAFSPSSPQDKPTPRAPARTASGARAPSSAALEIAGRWLEPIAHRLCSTHAKSRPKLLAALIDLVGDARALALAVDDLDA